MAKKDKVTISRTDDFAEVEAELSSAMEMLDSANTRVETLLQEHKQSDADETSDAPAAETQDAAPEPQTAS